MANSYPVNSTVQTIITNARWTALVWLFRDIGKAIAVPYSVTLWGSNPDETDNDDCWTGEDFATADEAIAAYRALVMFPTDGIAEHCVDWEYVMIDGPNIHEVTAQPDQVSQRRRRRDNSGSIREWRDECAMQAGMAFGCDGYNDEMGY